MTALVDIVIVTHNTRETTVRAVASVCNTPRGNCIVVDNASTDGTAEALSALGCNVQIIRSATNRGYGAACNLGATAGAAEFLLILNSDIVVRPEAIQRLLLHMETHPDDVVAGGCLVDAGTDRPQVGFTIRGFPTVQGQIALLFGLERLWPRNPVSRREAMLDFDFSKTQSIDGQPAGACLCCRRSDFDGVGGFDECFFYWFEDVDLVRRLARRGKIAYVHDAVFEHLGGTTFKQWSRPEIVVARYESLLRYFAKHHSRGQLIALRCAIALVAAVRLPLLAVRGSDSTRAYLRVLEVACRFQDRHSDARETSLSSPTQ
jgi:N-acetylglucosaminyl-diphospho-decaprenol L-rhamnosyltransferase